jgi:hypothetical protein
MEGCGEAFRPHLDDPLRQLIYRALLHPNRFIRCAPCRRCASPRCCAAGSAPGATLPPMFWPAAEQMREGVHSASRPRIEVLLSVSLWHVAVLFQPVFLCAVPQGGLPLHHGLGVHPAGGAAAGGAGPRNRHQARPGAQVGPRGLCRRGACLAGMCSCKPPASLPLCRRNHILNSFTIASPLFQWGKQLVCGNPPPPPPPPFCCCSDNWSQVRFAASVATRTFMTCAAAYRERVFPLLLPHMCLNR